MEWIEIPDPGGSHYLETLDRDVACYSAVRLAHWAIIRAIGICEHQLGDKSRPVVEALQLACSASCDAQGSLRSELGYDFHKAENMVGFVARCTQRQLEQLAADAPPVREVTP